MASRGGIWPALLVIGAAMAGGCGRGPARPNMILIVVDTLRADALRSYGGATPTPALDRIASEGLRFDHAVAQAPWTTPSLVSILTSLYPHEHGQGVSVRGVPRGPVRPLPEALRAVGYRTAAFSEVPCEHLMQMPGFETCHFPPGYSSSDPQSSAQRTFAAARAWLETRRQAPFFLLIHTFEVHDYFAARDYARAGAERALPGYQGPFRQWRVNPEAPGDTGQMMDSLLGASDSDIAFVRALYQATVLRLDEEIAALDRTLADLGLREDAVLVITSDHGEGFEPVLKRIHHGGRLHDDLLRVPLIVRWNGRIRPGMVREVVESIDILPTLLALAGVPPDPGHRGKPLLQRRKTLMPGRLVFEPRPISSPKAFSEESTLLVSDTGKRLLSTTRQVAMHSPPFKVIQAGDRIELYDLRHDPREAFNLVDLQPERARVVLSAAQGAGGAAELDTERARQALESLRSLGYVQ